MRFRRNFFGIDDKQLTHLFWCVGRLFGFFWGRELLKLLQIFSSGLSLRFDGNQGSNEAIGRKRA